MISRFAKSFVIIVVMLLLMTMVAFLHPPTRTYMDLRTGEYFGEGSVKQAQEAGPPGPVGEGHVIMSKLGNETAKAELGRATWKLLHTMTLRFPEKPTPDEREALRTYLHLTSRLYPCGECAAEFQQLLKTFPPQTSSRRSASTWLCAVHNKVNERLQKPSFDCAHLDETYDCGCGEQPSTSETAPDSSPMDLERDPTKDDITGIGLIKGGDSFPYA
ncbi:ERV/ALR sulfhydryl oxidase domain-containing protein [Infundibulicybe gibba]|nr:ERV/ALR sulfhydryl oxidase domain-containing protein [Infundibulicybe gibba]